MAAGDATPVPRYAVALRIYFEIRSTTNTLITGGLTALAGSVSLDGAAYGATTNTPTEIGTSGTGYLDLTAGEMTSNATYVVITASNANAVAFTQRIYPLQTLALNAVTITNPSGDALTVQSTGGNGRGMVNIGHGTGQGQVNQGGATAAGVLNQGGATSGDGVDNWAQADGHGVYNYGAGTAFNGVLTQGDGGQGEKVIALQGNYAGQILQGNGDAPGLQSVGGATGNGIVADGNGGAPDIQGGFSTGAITAAVIATGAIGADALAADAIAEIADGVWDELLAGHVTAGSAGLALADAADEDTPAAIAAAVWDLTDGVETGITPRQALRGFGAALLGVNSGNETNTPNYRNITNTKGRITATLDPSQNRTSVTLDLD